MPWIEKHRPKNFADIKGQDSAVETVINFVESFSKTNKKKALILHGPPGVGKTTLVLATALETNSEIFELNASDLRNKAKLDEVLRPALEQQSLIKKSKIILVDEVDGISAVDRGGLPELLSLIENTSYPVIITANDVWNKKLSKLRKKTELMQLKEITYSTIKDVLIHVLKKENKFINNEILTKIALKSKGDLRAAINDLQAAVGVKDPSTLTFDERNKEIDIFKALKMVFKSKPTDETLRIYDSVKMPIDEIILWIEQNIPLEYKGEELAKAYEALSKVDVFKGRIYKQQYWRFLVYENILLSYGISASKHPDKVLEGFTKYQKPTRILKIWLNNQRTAKKKSIAQKYAQYVHVGKRRAQQEFPVLKQILKDVNIRRELKLTGEECEYLDKVV